MNVPVKRLTDIRRRTPWLSCLLFKIPRKSRDKYRFRHAPAIHMRDLAMSGVSVRRSVSPSHAGIKSKLITVGLCSFHRRVTQKLKFFNTKLRTL